MTVVVLINDKFNIFYLDNVIFHRLQRRLSDRNYRCRRRPRYLIFSQFSICCCQNAFALQRSQLANVGSHHCRGPHRIAGPRAPRPHDPPLPISPKYVSRVCISSMPRWIRDTFIGIYKYTWVNNTSWSATILNARQLAGGLTFLDTLMFTDGTLVVCRLVCRTFYAFTAAVVRLVGTEWTWLASF